MRRKFAVLPLSLAIGLAFVPAISQAVRLSADGTGQALIYPYYTTRAVDGSAFNTYLSIANTSPDAKALKVQVREGRSGRSVLELNVFLGASDMWTAALVPDAAGGARLLTADPSCTNPAVPAGGLMLANSPYVDGRGEGPDRANEGYLEVIEMGHLTGASANNVTVLNGTPINCGRVQGPVVTLQSIETPTGGLTGTATLINVNRGLDASYDATALDDLASAPLYSDLGTGLTDFNHPSIVPVSTVVDGRYVYRSHWANPRDAVSAALITYSALNEFVLDSVTRSNTDWVITLPTRRLHVQGAVASAPFGRSSTALGVCEPVFVFLSSRDGRTEDFVDHPPILQVDDPLLCWSATVIPVRNAAPHMPTNPSASDVLGSVNGPRRSSDVSVDFPVRLTRTPLIENGWGSVSYAASVDPIDMTSLPDSTRTDQRTGDVFSSAHRFIGFPMVGFAVRTFENGFLNCAGQRCLGNYGGAFALKRQRFIMAPP